MENSNHRTTNNNINNNRNKTSRPVSISDTDSQVSFYSPYQFESQLPSNEPAHGAGSFDSNNANSMAVVPFSKYLSKKKGSSESLSYQGTPPVPPPRPPHLDMFTQVGKEGVRVEDEVGGGERRSRAAVGSTYRRPERIRMVMKAALGLRFCEMMLCMISFSVMAADKTQGWSGDSYYRYREYRYLVGVNILGLSYSAFQAYDLVYHFITGKHVISHYLRYYFYFVIDQMIAYLLMSASSSAATRLLDWVSNWGKDAFTEMASASIGISFLAFFAFSLSSLICGYCICCYCDSG